jgi:hypothetical protein
VRLVPRPPFASLSASVLGSSSRIFESLGFETTNMVESVSDVSLSPPDIDPHSPASRIARNKLLRGWVELSAWTADFSKRHGRLAVYAVSTFVPQLTSYIHSPSA